MVMYAVAWVVRWVLSQARVVLWTGTGYCADDGMASAERVVIVWIKVVMLK